MAKVPLLGPTGFAMIRLLERCRQLPTILSREIWQPSFLTDHSLRGWFYALLRVISITWSVFNKTKAASRAAALSFSSLLGLGPLVALTVLIAGFTLGTKNPDIAVNTLSRLMNFIAPQVGEFHGGPNRPTDTAGAASTPGPGTHPTRPDGAGGDAISPSATDSAGSVRLNPRLVRMMNQFIAQGRSGSAGTVGVFSLVIIVLLLFKTVEDTFNEIWGIHRGRSIFTRFVYYWTILTLGAVLFFASITLVGAGAFFGVFKNTIGQLPFSTEMIHLLRWLLPVFSFALVVALLTVFYRVIPHTRVYWRAAFAGALVVASLLVLNNYLAFLYVRRVILTESLYGSLGFPLVVMFGLYVFWLYVLIGGQISYAIQNVHFRNSQAAWIGLPYATRERLSLVVFLAICRRFQACQPPATPTQIGALLRVPTQIVNECLNRLIQLDLITVVSSPARGSSSEDACYQPAKPLSRLTLFDFKKRGDLLGQESISGSFEQIDPLLLRYADATEQLGQHEFFQKSIEQLLVETPFPSQNGK